MTRGPGQPKTVPWAITFADMALLLLCFFVMLSAIPHKSADIAVAPPTLAAAPPTPTAATTAGAAGAAALLRTRLADSIEQGWLEVGEDGSRLHLRFGTADGFDVGSDQPTPRTVALLDTLADALGGSDARITVSGHTDDLPISTGRFRDNWDLSSARAVSVIRELVMSHGIDPKRLEARGYADTRPLANNDTEQERARNRRIEIEIAWER